MNIFEMAQIPLNKAIETMELDAGAAAIIAVPERTLEVSIPVKMDDGTTKSIYRLSQPAQHNPWPSKRRCTLSSECKHG